MAEEPMNDADPLKAVFRAAGMFVVHCVAGCVILAMMLFVVPHFVVILQDFDAELPAMTQWVISLSMFVVSYWYLTIGPAVGVDAAVLVGLSLLPSGSRWAVGVWFAVVLIAMILFAGFVAVALFLPMWNIQQALS